MWEEILKAALESGLWAVLFCVLLLYQLRDGRARECKYRQTIDALIGRLGVLDGVATDVRETLEAVRRCEKKKNAVGRGRMPVAAMPCGEGEAQRV